jgi:hypothetical protein
LTPVRKPNSNPWTLPLFLNSTRFAEAEDHLPNGSRTRWSWILLDDAGKASGFHDTNEGESLFT